jgi:hypothetical protein
VTVLDHLSEPAKHAVDALSAGAVIGTLFSVLPQISALLAAIWVALRIVESLQTIRLNGRKLRGRE